MDHAHVCRIWCCRRDQPPLQVPAGQRPDWAQCRLRHANPLRIRHRRPHGCRRIRQVWCGSVFPCRHGALVPRHSLRTYHYFDDHKWARRRAVGDVHRGSREAGSVSRGAGWHATERYLEGIYRPERVHLPAGSIHATGDRHHRIRLIPPAALESHQH